MVIVRDEGVDVSDDSECEWMRMSVCGLKL